MTDHWGADKQTAAGSAGHGRSSGLLGRWYQASRATLGWSFDAWYDGAVAAVAPALEHGIVDRDALMTLGAARSARSRTEREALDDLECAFREAGDAVDAPLRGTARRALVSGFRSSSPRRTWFGDARALSRSLRKLYVDAEARRGPKAASHALLLVDVNLSWLTDAERGVVLSAAAECLHAQFPFADTIAALGEPRFGLVVRRHPGLAVGAESLEVAFGAEPLLAGATTVLLVPLPERAGGVGPFVRELSGAQRPLRVRAYTPRAAAGGGPGADLLKAAVPLAAFRPEQATPLGRRLVGALADGSGMLAAALAALVLAAGVNQVLGPRAFVGAPTTQLFGLGPPPVSLDTPVQSRPAAPPPPVEEVAAVVEEAPIDAVPAASVRAPVAPVVEAAAPAASDPPPPAPAPPPEPALVEAAPPPPEPAPVDTVADEPEPEVVAAPVPAEDDDPCEGLSGREARRCERRGDRQERREARAAGEAGSDDDGGDDEDD